jgi:hypothetical protein
MVLTTAAAWPAYVTAEAARWGLTISTSTTAVHALVSGSSPVDVGGGNVAAPAIVAVRPNGAAIDPFTRSAQPMTLDVSISLEAARGIETGTGLVGRIARLYVGAEGLPWTSWLLRYALQIADVAIGSDGTVTLRCVDLVELLFRLKVSGAWVAAHPRDVLEDIVGVLPGGFVSSSVPAAETARTHWSLTRAAALPYGNGQGAVYDPRQRPTGSAASMAQPASAYVGDIIAMLGWTLARGANGVGEIRAPRTTTDRDIPADDVRRVSDMRFGEWVTAIRVEYLTEPQENLMELLDLDAARRMTERELEPQAARRFVLADPNTLTDNGNVDAERDLTATWANAAAYIEEGYTIRDPAASLGLIPTTYGISTTAEQIPLIDAPVGGLSGFRWRESFKFGDAVSASAVSGTVTISGFDWPRYFPTWNAGDVIAYCEIPQTDSNTIHYATVVSLIGTTLTCSTTEADHTLGVTQVWIAQHPDDRPSVTRPVYLQIRGDSNGIAEIVRVTRPGVPIPFRYTSLGTIGSVGSVMNYRGQDWPRALMVDIERAQLGTTATSCGPRSVVSDVTMPYAMAADRMSRFARGCPTVDLELAPRHADLQEGDIVTIVSAELFSRWHLPGAATTDVRWEVVSVTPDLDAGCVRVTLAWLSQTTPAYSVTPTASVDVVAPWVDLGTPPPGSCYWPATTGRRLVGPTEQIEGTTDMTFSVWVRADRRENGHTIASRWGGSDNCWRLQIRNSGALRFYAATSGTDSGNYRETATGVLTEGLWHHVVVQYQQGSPAIVTLYVDGQIVTTTLSGTLPTALRSSAAALCLGADSSGGGQISEVYMTQAMLWGKALSGGQVLALISGSGRPAAPPMRDASNRPVAWWPLASYRAALGGGLTETGTTPALVFGTDYP